MHVTVCICTRDRGDGIVGAVRSVLASSYSDFDVIVVDQSVSGETEAAMSRIVTDSARCRYLRSQTRGSSAAHNVAVSHAAGPILAFTDDDCVVAPDWLETLVRYFASEPRVGAIFGVVDAGAHDRSAGFIPTCAVPRARRVSSPWMKWREHGIGANMALRAEALAAAGPFDEMLGSGGTLYASLDRDMAYRILRAGYTVMDVPDARVVHFGFRTWAQGRPMMRRVGVGIGATYMKHLLLGDTAVLPTLFVEWFRCVRWRRALTLRSRCGVACALGYLHGIALSFVYPRDRATRTYIPGRIPGRAGTTRSAITSPPAISPDDFVELMPR